MDITSFWGAKLTEDSPAILTVPEDTVFMLDQLTLAGPCSSIQTVYVKSVFVGEDVGESDSEDDKESIESDSDEEATSTSTLAVGHLTWGRKESLRTSLVFGAAERVKFTLVGDGEVHLTGHLVMETLDFADSEDDSMDSQHAVAVAGDDFDVFDEDEEDEEVDSDEGETIYEKRVPTRLRIGGVTSASSAMDADDMGDEESDEEDEEDDDFEGDLESDEDDENGVIVLAESDSDDERDPREVRRLLLGEDAGDRPMDDDDDELDDAALYAAIAADDSDDEEADAAEFIKDTKRKENRKKRSRADTTSFDDAEFHSPGHKRAKHYEHANGSYQYNKHNKKQRYQSRRQ